MLVERTKEMPSVHIRHEDPQADRLMATTDVAVTKGNRNIVLELAALGVPSETVTSGLNRVDDIRTARAAKNVTVRVHEVDDTELGNCLNERWSFGHSAQAPAPNRPTAPHAEGVVAQRISELVAPSRLRQRVVL